MRNLLLVFVFAFVAYSAGAAEYHVSVKGRNGNSGTALRPFRTIAFAVGVARPGDVVTVHAGTYRELVAPAVGGSSDLLPIVFRAAVGERVLIKGSEVVSGWKLFRPGVWKAVVPNTFFAGHGGSVNPFGELISGDWFFPGKRNLHTGEVFLNGHALHEAASLDLVLAGSGLWFAEVSDSVTVLYAGFNGFVAGSLVEVSVRPACFYPARTGVNFITVSGFHFSQAATQWAAPTAEQVGMIGTNWSKGWVIENNEVSDSKCVGIALGKDRASGHNVWSAHPELDGSVLYNEMAVRVVAAGWSKDLIGSHEVRGNVIHDCGQAGICGSFGAAYSRILGNHIYDVYTFRPFWGAEMAGIKFHGAVDVLISGNRVHNTNIGIWLDWMSQGARVSGNLVYGNDYIDFFPEVNHGPLLVDNNFFLSAFAVKDWSEGSAFAHNLIAGLVSRAPQSRATPYFFGHTTAIAGLKPVTGGENRFFNNIFIGNAGKAFALPSGSYFPPDALDAHSGYGLGVYDDAALPVVADGNVYLNGAAAFAKEQNLRLGSEFNPGLKLSDSGDSVFLFLRPFRLKGGFRSKVVNTGLLGRLALTATLFENPNGSALVIDRDYFGFGRDTADPGAGPGEGLFSGKAVLVWPADLNYFCNEF